MAELTVSIATGGNRVLVLNCLASVYRAAAGLDVEVVVVDNKGSDGTAGAIREAYPGARVIVNGTQEGFSANHNKALKTASGDYALILNDDTVLDINALRVMVEFMQSHTEAGAAGGMLLNPDGTPQYAGRDRPTLMAAVMISLGLHRLFPDNPVTSGYFMKKDYTEAAEVESVNGAAMMLRMDAVRKVGLLDKGFYLFCEDVDYSIRLREAGYKLYFLPDAKITHVRGASTGGRRIVWIYHQSLLRFYKKHLAKKHIFIVNWLVYAGIWARLAVYMAYGNVRRKRKV